MKKPSLIRYLVAVAVVLAMLVISLILLLLPGPIRTALVPPTPTANPTPTATPPLATMVVPDSSYASLDTSGCEVFDPPGGRDSASAETGSGFLRVSPGEERRPGCFAVPSDTEITITLENWDLNDADVVLFLLDEVNLIGEIRLGDEVDNSVSITTMFPADMPPSILWIEAYRDDGTYVGMVSLIFFIDAMAPTPFAPECQGFEVGPSPLIGFRELTISLGVRHDRRCYAVPANTGITLTWEDKDHYEPEFVTFYHSTYDEIGTVYRRDAIDNTYSITISFLAAMPPSQLWIVAVDNDLVWESAPVIIFIER